MLWEKKLAVAATVTRYTSAHIPVVPFMAGGAIVAGFVFTPADGGTTVMPCVAWRAGANVPIWAFLAGTTILARVH